MKNHKCNFRLFADFTSIKILILNNTIHTTPTYLIITAHLLIITVNNFPEIHGFLRSRQLELVIKTLMTFQTVRAKTIWCASSAKHLKNSKAWWTRDEFCHVHHSVISNRMRVNDRWQS